MVFKSVLKLLKLGKKNNSTDSIDWPWPYVQPYTTYISVHTGTDLLSGKLNPTFNEKCVGVFQLEYKFSAVYKNFLRFEFYSYVLGSSFAKLTNIVVINGPVEA